MCKTPSRPRFSFPPLVFLPVLLALPRPAVAQAQQEKPPLRLPGVEAGIVRVEVFATDKNSRPVTDLTKSDLEVREDGHRVDILHFVPPGAGLEGTPETPAVAPEAALPAAGPRAEQRLLVVVYVDDARMMPARRNGVLRSLEKFVAERLQPEDRVMLVRHDQSLSILRPFGSDFEALQEDFKRLEKLGASGAMRELEKRKLLDDLDNAPTSSSDPSSSSMAQDLYSRVQNFAEREYGEEKSALSILLQFVGAVGGLPGRKAFIYASEGMPRRPGEVAVRSYLSRYQTSGIGFANELEVTEESQRDLSDLMRQVAVKANAGRVTFYAVDASGPSFDVSAQVSTRGEDRSMTGIEGEAERQGNREPLAYLAAATGGLVLRDDTTLPRQLERLNHDFRTAYSIAYVPPVRDSQFHKIEVRTTRKDVVLRYREGYREKGEEERSVDLLLGAFFQEAPNPLGMRLQAGRQSPGKSGHAVVPLLVKIPVPLVHFEPDGAFQKGHLHIYVAVQDDKGGTSDVQTRDVPLRVANEKMDKAKDGVLGYGFNLGMSPGPQKISVVARDDLASTFSASTLDVNVEKVP